VKLINDLIESERSLLTDTQFTGVQFTGFATSWQAVERYHTFLTIILDREARATENHSNELKAWMATPPSPTRQLTDRQRHRLDELSKTTEVLHLEIESFYLFANILLDTVARAIEKYFGQVRTCSLDSHHDLINNFGKYVAQKKLAIPPHFMETARRNRQNITTFRDQEIAHGKRLNRVTATALTKQGHATMIATSTVVPMGKLKPQADSIHVRELMVAVEEYIAAAIEIVKTNRDKRKLTFAE
jgi:hypothetical protein